MRMNSPSRELLDALRSNRRNTSPLWAWDGSQPYYGNPYNFHPFRREASSNFYGKRKYGSEWWERAYAHLLAKCLDREEKKKSSGRSDAGADGGKSGCACTDDSRPIPCDGRVHERTFGPVMPAWPDPGVEWGWPEVERVRGIAQHGHPINKNADGSAAKQMSGNEPLDTMLTDGPIDLWGKYGSRPSLAEIHSRRLVKVDVKRSAKIGATVSKYAGARPGGSARVNTAWSVAKRDTGDAGLKGLVRGYIGADSTGLAVAIADWVSKFTCESQRHLWCKTPYPQVVESAATEGGSGQPDALASDGGGQNWFVAEFAEIHGEDYTSGAAAITPVACVRAKFRCIPGGVTIPPLPMPAYGAAAELQQSQADNGAGQDRNDSREGQRSGLGEPRWTTSRIDMQEPGAAPWEPTVPPWQRESGDDPGGIGGELAHPTETEPIE